MSELPEDMIDFSSDFPHFEGYSNPMATCREQLANCSKEGPDRLKGGSMTEVYAGMGDPLA